MATNYQLKSSIRVFLVGNSILKLQDELVMMNYVNAILFNYVSEFDGMRGNNGGNLEALYCHRKGGRLFEV